VEKIFFLKKELIAAVPTDAKSSENVISIYKIATVSNCRKIDKTDAINLAAVIPTVVQNCHRLP
jgi:hypothetical protein